MNTLADLSPSTGSAADPMPPRGTVLSVRSTAAVLLCLLPLAASAHIGADAGTHHGFVDGLVHPVTGLDHLSVMLAVGLWSSLSSLGARRVWVAPASFAALLLVGALLATAGLVVPAVEPMIAASLVVIGLLLASRCQLPAGAAAALVGGFALFHGAAHGAELGAGAALAGMVISTAALHLAGITLGRALQRRGGLLPRLTALVGGTAMVALGANLLLG